MLKAPVMRDSPTDERVLNDILDCLDGIDVQPCSQRLDQREIRV